MTTRALHFDWHHAHTTTIGGEAVSDYGAYLHAQQAEYEAEAAEAPPVPDLLKPKNRPTPEPLTDEARITRRKRPPLDGETIRVWHADHEPLPTPKGRIFETA